MEKIFVIGGMGAGKSTAVHALEDLGLPVIDLDEVGHEILHWDQVEDELRTAFGDGIFDESGDVDRRALARKAFASSAETRKLNHITMPRIEDRFTELLGAYERSGAEAVVVEYSVFKSREMSLADEADIVIAVVAPEDLRVARAVASGFDEDDVRRRIANQITDEERMAAADAVFVNDSTKEHLYAEVARWWCGNRRN